MNLTIKDLSASTEIDQAAMTTVHGGGNVYQRNHQDNYSGDATVTAAQFGGGNSILAAVAPTQTNLAANTAFNSDVDVRKKFDLDITKVAVGGIVL